MATVLVASLSGACGGRDSDADVLDAPGTETTAAVSVQNAPAETVDCSALPEDLIVEVGLGYTRARQLDPENLEFMDETLGLPDPVAFRTFADAFERLDTSSLETIQS